MKKIIALLLAAILILSLAACAAKPESETPATDASQTETTPADTAAETGTETASAEPITLKWGSWALAEDSLKGVYQSMADGYNESNPYNTQVSTDYYYSYADYLSTLLIDVAGGNGPDVAHIKAEWLPQLLALGVVRSIGEYMSADVLADYSEDALTAVTVDGKMMALPWFSNTYALLVNTDLCEQAGVDYTAISSWADLMTAAEKISALGDDIYGLAIPDSNGVEKGEGYNTFPALWAYGGDFEADGQILLNTDAAVSAYTDIQNLFVNGISTTAGSNSFKELRNLFAAGKIGFYWDHESGLMTAGTAAADPAEFYARTQAITIPGVDANGSGYLISHELVVFDSCTDEKMEAMGHFLDYMSGSDVIGILRNAGQGKMSSRASVMADIYSDCTEVKQEEGGYTYAYVKAMETAKPLPTANIHFQDADAMLTDMVTELAQGGDVTEILGKYQEKIQNLYNG